MRLSLTCVGIRLDFYPETNIKNKSVAVWNCESAVCTVYAAPSRLFLHDPQELHKCSPVFDGLVSTENPKFKEKFPCGAKQINPSPGHGIDPVMEVFSTQKKRTISYCDTDPRPPEHKIGRRRRFIKLAIRKAVMFVFMCFQGVYARFSEKGDKFGRGDYP